MVNVQLPKVLFRDFNSTYNVYLHNMRFCHSMWNLLLYYCNSKRREIAICKYNATCA